MTDISKTTFSQFLERHQLASSVFDSELKIDHLNKYKLDDLSQKRSSIALPDVSRYEMRFDRDPDFATEFVYSDDLDVLEEGLGFRGVLKVTDGEYTAYVKRFGDGDYRRGEGKRHRRAEIISLIIGLPLPAIAYHDEWIALNEVPGETLSDAGLSGLHIDTVFTQLAKFILLGFMDAQKANIIRHASDGDDYLVCIDLNASSLDRCIFALLGKINRIVRRLGIEYVALVQLRAVSLARGLIEYDLLPKEAPTRLEDNLGFILEELPFIPYYGLEQDVFNAIDPWDTTLLPQSYHD